MIYSLGDKRPSLHPSCFIAPSADLIGDITMGADASAWFNVVMRGDNDPITIGERSNIQDGSILHTDLGAPLTIGREVTVGHKVMLHGCSVGDGSLVGMNAVVLNHAKIGKHCIIGAGALITEGKVIPDYAVVMGAPGKVVRTGDAAQAQVLAASAEIYVKNSARFRAELTEAKG